MIETLAQVGRKLGLFQIKPTPMICNLSQVSDQKKPNLDQVENLAGDGISFAVQTHFWFEVLKQRIMSLV